MIGGFFDSHHATWDAHDRALFAALLTEQDVDIMAWAIGTQDVPERYAGPIMDAMRRVTGIDFTPEVGVRRQGDPARIVADGQAAAEDLQWKMRHTVDDMVASAWSARRAHG